jgi:hypothetical protein
MSFAGFALLAMAAASSRSAPTPFEAVSDDVATDTYGGACGRVNRLNGCNLSGCTMATDYELATTPEVGNTSALNSLGCEKAGGGFCGFYLSTWVDCAGNTHQ